MVRVEDGAVMVERMSSVEIEDVLSSIRRLVTEDLRPKPPVQDEKLLLTPALRVVPDVPRPEDPDVEPAPVLDVDLDADLAAALAGADAGVEGAMVEADAGPFPMFLHHASRVDVNADDTDRPSQDFAEAVTTIGAAIPAEGYESETGDVMPVPEWPESSWVAPDVIDGVEEAEVIAPPVADRARETWDEGAAETDWREEAAVAAPVEDGTVADAAEAAALAALAEDDLGDDVAPLTELDEDMLRDIVREIIREELHGSLGERITRNVRKLVRAEINRALMTQDLE